MKHIQQKTWILVMDSTVSSSKDPEQVLSLYQDNYTVNSDPCRTLEREKNKHLCILNERDGQGMAYD